MEPLLIAHESLLMEKIRLLCVMDMTFRRAANHRQISFEEIAQSTGLNQNEIECLVSLHLECLNPMEPPLNPTLCLSGYEVSLQRPCQRTN